VTSEFSADRGDAGVRLDRVLVRHLGDAPGVSRRRLQRLIAHGAVRINGRPVTRPSTRVAQHDVITVDLPTRSPRTPPVPEALPLDILYEDNDVIVVNKPPGQVSHPAFRNRSGTLLNALLGYASGRWTPALATRLDKETSGLVLVAKSGTVQKVLQEMSEARAIEKDYLAVVLGRPPARGVIDLPIDRDPLNPRRIIVRERTGLPSMTLFRRVRSVTLAPGRHVSLVRCRLVTGRMHQIRVHLAARGWPIAGDGVYGAPLLQLSRQALHAWRLALPHPRAWAARGRGSTPDTPQPTRAAPCADVTAAQGCASEADHAAVHAAARIEVTAPLPRDLADLLALLQMREIGEHGAEGRVVE
jgi:23S rRNA pseudouridine1911/1915/1917 synthase